MMIAFSDAHDFCASIVCLMKAADVMELDVTACQSRGVWHQNKRHGLSVYLRSDHRGAFTWRVEVWLRRRVFLATCCHEFKSIDVQEYRSGAWEAEITQLGNLAILPTHRPWRQGALH